MSGVDLVAYRQSTRERARISSLLSLLPGDQCRSGLDIGARDGYISELLAERIPDVTALDLEKPAIEHPSIRPVQGDVTALEFESNEFDLVVCSEVLEHIPPARLAAACDEIRRVTKRWVVIGVPYRQDLRLGRSTCQACGAHNPAWGHVNSFDESKLERLFHPARMSKVDLVGKSGGRTNWLSTGLMDWAGNPWGNYAQQEPCMKCGSDLVRPEAIGLPLKIACHIAHRMTQVQNRLVSPGAMWIHCLFEK